MLRISFTPTLTSPVARPRSAPASRHTRRLEDAATARGRTGLAVLAAVGIALGCGGIWTAGYMIAFGSAIGLAGAAAFGAFEVIAWSAACAGGAAAGWLLPVGRRPSLPQAVAVAGFALGFGTLRIAAERLLFEALGLAPKPLGQALAFALPTQFLVVSALAGLGVGLKTLLRRRERAAAAARVEAELARARTRAMHSRLHPDLLLASLDAISRRIPHDAAAADRLLLRVSDLLRLSLARARADHVTLAAELRYVEAFLEVEAGRAGSAARFHPQVPAGLLEARVPPGSVFAFVEAAHRAGAGCPPSVTLRAEARGGRLLLLRLAGDAPAPDAEHATHAGWEAMRALAASLEERSGAGASLRLAPRAGGGTEAVLELPLLRREAPCEAP